jgi:hypothetical protein
MQYNTWSTDIFFDQPLPRAETVSHCRALTPILMAARLSRNCPDGMSGWQKPDITAGKPGWARSSYYLIVYLQILKPQI